MTSSPLPPLSPTPRSTVRRNAVRARTDRAELYALLDAGLIGHLGMTMPSGPLVLPTAYGRDGETLYLHGSTGAATLRAAASGVPVCFTVTHVDGVVYSRSAFHHSMNHRCAVVQGVARLVTDPDERWHGLGVLTEHLAPGSWTASRQPDRRELAATAVLALDLAEASIKARTGPPGEDERDLREPAADWAGVLPLRAVLALDLAEASIKARTGPPGEDERDLREPAADWAGVLPLRTVWGRPEPCPLLLEGTPVPDRIATR